MTFNDVVNVWCNDFGAWCKKNKGWCKNLFLTSISHLCLYPIFTPPQ
jgi:hypothetical protein